ncbi:hypothetical protein [Amycolatopsis sp. cmx-11-51]
MTTPISASGRELPGTHLVLTVLGGHVVSEVDCDRVQRSSPN